MTNPPTEPRYLPPRGWLENIEPAGTGPSLRFLAAATLLAAVLRLAGLTAQSLWVDEIMTWRQIQPGAGLVVWEQLRDNIQGPLHLALLWPLVRLADTELMLRLPSAVAGILTVPLFGAVAGKLANGRDARLAVLLLAVNPFHIWYSQEGRGYALLVLCAVAMAWFFLRMATRGPTPGRALGLALVTAAAVWSNMSGIFAWLAIGAAALGVRPANRREFGLWALALGGGMVAALPWLSQAAGIWAVDRFLPGAETGAALRGATTLSPLAIPYSLFALFYGFSLGPSLRELHGAAPAGVIVPWVPLLLPAAAAVAVAGLSAFREPDRRLRLLLLWVAVPLLLLAFVAWRNIKPWNVRYLAVCLPWLLLLVARGLGRMRRRWAVATAAVLCGLTLVSLGGYFGADRYAKEDVRAAAAWIAVRDPGGQSVFVPSVTGVYAYYDRGRVETIDTYNTPALADAADADLLVADRLAGREHAWIVLARPWHLDPRGLLVPALARIGAVEEAGEFPGVRILNWRRSSSTAVNHES